jgi:hypothetical protein
VRTLEWRLLVLAEGLFADGWLAAQGEITVCRPGVPAAAGG